MNIAKKKVVIFVIILSIYSIIAYLLISRYVNNTVIKPTNYTLNIKLNKDKNSVIILTNVFKKSMIILGSGY